MDASFMESVWWVFRQLWDKGLVYRGYKVRWKVGSDDPEIPRWRLSYLLLHLCCIDESHMSRSWCMPTAVLSASECEPSCGTG